jgi:hypothetical protein
VPTAIETVRANRQAVWQRAKELADKAAGENRAFSQYEQERFEALNVEIDAYDERLRALDGRESRQAAHEATVDGIMGRPVSQPGVSDHPLAFSPAALDRLQDALDARESVRVTHDDGVETRATLQTGTYGSNRVWGANVLGGPRLLHVAAGVPKQRVDGAFASHPVLTLPTASAAVGETVTLGEYAASTAGAVTLARYGRWTDVTRESQLGTDAETLVAMHATGVALDLDKVLIDATETAAGAAVAFTADVPAAIRKAQALVIANTAAPSAADLVILTHPDNASLLQDVSPIGGITMAEGFQKFSGSLVYPSNAVNTGFITVANLRAGARYFEARSFQTETDVAIKTSVITIASSVIVGYGVTLAGHASMVDVLTP